MFLLVGWTTWKVIYLREGLDSNGHQHKNSHVHVWLRVLSNIYASQSAGELTFNFVFPQKSVWYRHSIVSLLCELKFCINFLFIYLGQFI